MQIAGVLAVTAAVAQAQTLFCDQFPGATLDGRTWQQVNNTIYEWHNQIDANLQSIADITVC